MNERYFAPCKGGRWTTGRVIEGRTVTLVQDSPLTDPGDAECVLRYFGIEVNQGNLDHFFPIYGAHGRCPTLDLLELFAPEAYQPKPESGV